MNEIINNLRESRKADDLIERLKAGSLESRAQRIAEALSSSDFAGGPATLVATYPHHVLASREGVLMRVSLEENEDSIKFGKVEIFDVPAPASSIAAEAIETAKSAVDFIMAEDFKSAAPMINSISRALDIKGNLSHEIDQDLQLKSLQRKSWWKDVVNESVETLPNIPQPRTNDVAGSLDDLLSVIRTESAEAVRTLQKLGSQSLNPLHKECAQDIAEDLKTTINLLSSVNRENSDEMCRIYENVVRVAPELLKGAKFLSVLGNK